MSESHFLGALWGAIVGDALGVPVETVKREVLKSNPVTGMRGYGSHNLPPGSWSDDSSTILCTMESLTAVPFDTQDMGERFVRWFRHGHMTPFGTCFGSGGKTREALKKIMAGISAEQAGGTTVESNGNGSLMRIMPVSLQFSQQSTGVIIDRSERASKITHAHPRSQMSCAFYSLLVNALQHGLSREDALAAAAHTFRTHYESTPFRDELEHFSPLLDGKLATLDESQVRGTFYVVDSLIASVWCFMTADSYTETVLRAVNLGEDTDSTASISGGLAGLLYGAESIPTEWLNTIVRREFIDGVIDGFMVSLGV